MSDEFKEIKKILETMNKNIQNINDRLTHLEKQTDDIHQFTPFVGWLESIGQQLSTVKNIPYYLSGYRKVNSIEMDEKKC